MSRLEPLHLEDFMLLRYVASDLDRVERRTADEHLAACALCSKNLEEIRRLDEELRHLAQEEKSGLGGLSPEDPFHARPVVSARRLASGPGIRLVEKALDASGRAGAESKRLLQAVRESPANVAATLSGLSVSEPSHRYALLYALREAGSQITESPARALTFARETLKWLGLPLAAPDSASSDAEAVLPLSALFGQAHFLAGQACIWTGEFEKARHHLEAAYRAFAKGGGDEVSLALVEYHESQRRSFVGKAGEGLVLARRAAATLESLGLEEYLARARLAEGQALFDLGKQKEAIETFRCTLPVFEKWELWRNYVAALNSMGECFLRLGQLDEARREYARALRRLSRGQHPALVAWIRHGLANLLFSAGRFREAAMSFAQAVRLYQSLGVIANALTASLFEIEGWASNGDTARARHRLQIFLTEVARHDALDPSIVVELERALSGRNPNLKQVAELRQHAEEMLRQRLERNSS